MEDMVAGISPDFWRGKKVYLTGHTGFKGAWFSIWLASLGAHVYGYALNSLNARDLFRRARVAELLSRSTIADIRDKGALLTDMQSAQPEIVFHFAAQSLVLDSYEAPTETYEVNVMGTANVLDAARRVESLKSIVIITTDKVYENHSWEWGYRETDQLGGYDPYSNSKACCELVTDAFRRSFFNGPVARGICVGVATARAGNVIGGGDQASNRLVPDFIRAALAGETVAIRNPRSTRPWQHVLEPLAGYMMLANRLYREPRIFSEGWNFGPRDESVQPVGNVIDMLQAHWPDSVGVKVVSDSIKKHEAGALSLDCSKATARLGWRPRWTLNEALRRIVEFERACQQGQDAQELCLRQIAAYSEETALGSKVD